MFGINLIDLCHDTGHVPMDMQESVCTRQFWKDQVWEVPALVGVPMIDEVGHSPGNEFCIPFFILFVIKKHNAFFITDFSGYFSFGIPEIANCF